MQAQSGLKKALKDSWVKFKDHLNLVWRITKLAAPLLLFIIAGGWFPDGLGSHDWFMTGWGLAAFVWGSIIAYGVRREFISVHAATNRPKPHQVLIMPISSISGSLEKSPEGYAWRTSKMNGEKVEAILHNRLEEFAEQKLEVNFPWQQTLRGIKHHKDRIKTIYLLGSSGDRGSYHRLQDCHAFINHYFPSIEVIEWEVAVDFEDIKKQCDEINAIVKDAANSIPMREIMIDATGGQKTTSIAAALVTINNGALEFQYVSTQGEHEVIAINTNAVGNDLG